MVTSFKNSQTRTSKCEEVKRAYAVKVGKSPGIDNIPADLLKQGGDEKNKSRHCSVPKNLVA